MGMILVRNLGSRMDLKPGEWLSDPIEHRPGVAINYFVACPDCGAIEELDAMRVRVGGAVDGSWECQAPSCGFESFIQLEGHGEPVFKVRAR